MAITALEAVARLRARVDVAGDVGDPPAGYKYWWQYDDASCAISNAEMARIIDEAQTEFCRRSPIRDRSSPACRINLRAGVDSYGLHPSVLAIERVWLAREGVELGKSFQPRLDDPRFPATDNPYPLCYHVDVENHLLQVVPAPKVADALHLHVRRLPLCAVDWEHQDHPLEIDDLHFEDLLLYAMYLVYSNRDYDQYDPQAANTASERFRSRVGAPVLPSDLDVNRVTAGTVLRVTGHY